MMYVDFLMNAIKDLFGLALRISDRWPKITSVQIITSFWILIQFCKNNWFSLQFRFFSVRFLHQVLFNVCTLPSAFQFTVLFLMPSLFTPLRYGARNGVLLYWIGPTNCQPKWRRTRSIEMWREDKYFESLTVDLIVLEDELWIRECEKPAEVIFLKTELWKLSFPFLNFEVSLVRFGF